MSATSQIATQFAPVSDLPRTSMPRTAPNATIDEDAVWKQVVARDPEARFFYAVATTGVFCRPSCSSRLPLRKNARFFATPAAARAAGFRPCLKCNPTTAWGTTAWGGPLDKGRAATDRVRTH